MSQTKNDFLNNNVMTLKKTCDNVITPAPGATAWLFHPKWIEWNKRVKLISIKEMHLADVLREPPCQKC